MPPQRISSESFPDALTNTKTIGPTTIETGLGQLAVTMEHDRQLDGIDIDADRAFLHGLDQAEKRARRNNKASDAKLERDTVGQYLHEIGQIPLLDPSEEQTVAQIVARGHEAREEAQRDMDNGIAPSSEALEAERVGEQARQRLLRSNLRLVIGPAKRRLHQGLDLEELIQEGNFGLNRATKKFDWTMGTRFSTYAVPWIRQAITRGIEEKGKTIRHTESAYEHLRRIHRMLDQDPEEEHLNPEDRLRLRLASPVSLFAPTGVDGTAELVDTIGAEQDPLDDSLLEEERTAEIRSLVEKLLKHVEPEHREKVKLRYRLGEADEGTDESKERTYQQVGERLGISHEYAGRKTREELEKLRPVLAELGYDKERLRELLF